MRRRTALLVLVVLVVGLAAAPGAASAGVVDDAAEEFGWGFETASTFYCQSPLLGSATAQATFKYTMEYFKVCEYFEESSVETSDGVLFSAQNMADRIDSDIVRVNNSIEAHRTMAYRIAEAQYISDIKNGSSKAKAQENAKLQVESYLQTVFNNELLERNNRYVTTVKHHNTTMDGYIRPGGDGSNYITGFHSRQYKFLGENFTVEIINTTESTKSELAWIGHDDNAISGDGELFYDFSSASGVSDELISIDQGAFDNLRLDLESIDTEVTGEIETFSQSINESDVEDLNITDLASPLTLALEYSHAYNETGDSGYACALSWSADVGCNASTLYDVELHASNEKHTGMLFAIPEQVPTDGWETGYKYNGSNFSVDLLSDSYNGAIDENFTIHNITTRDGQSLDNVSFESYNFTTLNASAPLAVYQEWLNATKDIRDELADFGFGIANPASGLLDWLFSRIPGGVAGAAVGGVALIWIVAKAASGG